jgi:signal peptidase II
VHHLLSVIIVLSIVVIDELTGHYVLSSLPPNLYVAPFLNIVHVWNRGISFGLFSGTDNNMIFTVITILIVLGFAALMINEIKKAKLVPYAMIVGGGIGNVIDRIRHGAVFDFIDIHISSFHWPAFNIADACICVGGIAFAINAVFGNKKIVLE